MATRAKANTPQKIIAWVNLSTFSSNLLLFTKTSTRGPMATELPAAWIYSMDWTSWIPSWSSKHSWTFFALIKSSKWHLCHLKSPQDCMNNKPLVTPYQWFESTKTKSKLNSLTGHFIYTRLMFKFSFCDRASYTLALDHFRQITMGNPVSSPRSSAICLRPDEESTTRDILLCQRQLKGWWAGADSGGNGWRQAE